MARKIAILGGGIAGLTAAWELTSTPQLRSQNKVTVYQMGFRLGGKLASGRRGPEAKNVEHGLHVWFGFYENTFGLLRQLYDQWQRDPRGRFQHWSDVVEPRSYTPIGYRMNQQWALFPRLWLANADEPGGGRVGLTLWGVVSALLSALEQLVSHPLTRASEREFDRPPRLERAYERARAWLDRDAPQQERKPRWLRAVRRMLSEAFAALEAGQFAGKHPRVVRWMLARLAGHVHGKIRRYRQGPAEPYFDWLMADFIITILRGLLNPAYGMLQYGDLDRVNHLEFTTWMRDNGACEELLESPYIRVIYETAFQYPGGDRRRPNVEAGTCLRTVLRMIFTYKGALLWALRGGMGDVLVAPLYEVLKQRGVEFRFFHRVEQVRLSADKRRVDAIEVGIQARLRHPYEPLITVDYAPCWPDEPRWEYLEDGERLRRAGVNFESKWEKEPPHELRTLLRGRDFDDVVLALALGAFKPVNEQPGPCAELIAENSRFAEMVQAMGLVPSQALQLWMNYDLKELGFQHGRARCEGMLPAAVDGPDPLGIWADMTPVLKVEQWRGNPPRSVHYLCGVLETELYKEPSTNHDVPKLARELARDNAIEWLETYAGIFWPGACLPGTWTLDWNVLTDPEGRQGRARLEAQYVRANVDPTDCCVSTSVGTSQLRLGAAESGFDNLYLAGAWTKTPMNVECVEAAVMSGMLAARAICGLPRVIVGEDWLQPRATSVARKPEPLGRAGQRVGDERVEIAAAAPEVRPPAPPPPPRAPDDEPVAAQ